MTNATLSRISADYSHAGRAAKTALLSELMADTGWSRDHARRKLRQEAAGVPQTAPRGRPAGSRKYSSSAITALEYLWRMCGQPSGRHLAASMPSLLERLLRFAELPTPFTSKEVIDEVRGMSAATIDRYLRSARGAERSKVCWSAPEVPVRSAARVPRTDRPVGEVEITMLAHPTLGGDHLFTLVFEDLATGWELRRTIADAASMTIYAAMDWFAATAPFAVHKFTLGAGVRLMNWSLCAWCNQRGVALALDPRDLDQLSAAGPDAIARVSSAARPARSSQAVTTLNDYWMLLALRKNHFLTTTRAVSSIKTSNGDVAVYDEPRSPLARMRDLGGVDSERVAALDELDAQINPVVVAKELQRLEAHMVEEGGSAGRPAHSSRA